ncbi:MAG: hypothetical protein N2512_12325, partial [Armatimonadetes bacterium]|nr:hypothetical protein [Armatimonadota bacterium]
GLTRPLQDAIGYSHLVGYLRDETSWDATVEAIKRDTRRYAKRQLTWWRRHEEARWMAWETGVDFGLITTSVIRIARRMKATV